MSRQLSALAVLVVLALCTMALPAQGAQGEDSQAAKPAAEKSLDKPQAAETAPAPPPLRTIAVLDYKAEWLDDPQQAKEAGEALLTIVTDRLSALPEVTLVERREIDRILDEQKFNLTGMTDAEKSVKIGKLLGAKFLLSGRGFKTGDQIYVTTRVIDVETGQVKGIFTSFAKATPTGELIAKVCDGLVEKLPATLNALAPKAPPTPDPVELVRKRLGAAARVWVVASYEEHRRAPIIDPAIENELEHLLSGAGQKVKTLGKDAAKKVIDGATTAVELAKEHQADYCVIGQGFSEFGKRLSGDLVVCVARVELKIVDAKTGTVLAAGSLEARATDLGEHLAAKQALRKAAGQLFLNLAEKLQKDQTQKKAEGDAQKK